MKDCPTCGMPVDGEFCPRCDTGKPKTKAPARDPDWWRCGYANEYGRCDKPGTIANRAGGPWYCREHNSTPGFQHVRAPPPRGWQSLRDALRPPRQPGEDDA